MYLSEFLVHYAKSECLRIGLNMLKQKASYQQVIVALLKKHKDTKQAQQDFIKRCPEGIDEQFNALVHEVREVEQKLAKQRTRTSFSKPNKTLNKSNSMNQSFVSNNSDKQKMPTLFIKKDRSTPSKLLLTLNQEKLANASGSPDRKNSNRSGNLSSHRSGNLGSHRSGGLGSHRSKGALNSNRSKEELFGAGAANMSAIIGDSGENSMGKISPINHMKRDSGILGKSLQMKQSTSTSKLHNALFNPVRSSVEHDTTNSGSPPQQKRKSVGSPSKKKKGAAKKKPTIILDTTDPQMHTQ